MYEVNEVFDYGDKNQNKKLFKRAIFLTTYSIICFFIGMAIASFVSGR